MWRVQQIRKRVFTSGDSQQLARGQPAALCFSPGSPPPPIDPTFTAGFERGRWGVSQKPFSFHSFSGQRRLRGSPKKALVADHVSVVLRFVLRVRVIFTPSSTPIPILYQTQALILPIKCPCPPHPPYWKGPPTDFFPLRLFWACFTGSALAVSQARTFFSLLQFQQTFSLLLADGPGSHS